MTSAIEEQILTRNGYKMEYLPIGERYIKTIEKGPHCKITITIYHYNEKWTDITGHENEPWLCMVDVNGIQVSYQYDAVMFDAIRKAYDIARETIDSMVQGLNECFSFSFMQRR